MSESRKTGECEYVAMYKAKRIEVYALTLYSAQCKAAFRFGLKPNKAYQVSVTLCEREDGSEVIHTATF